MAKRRLWILASFAAGFILLSILGWLFLQREHEKPPQILPTGWQFYSSPTTLEPVGTVFRIDPQGIKYHVKQLDVPAKAGAEVMGKTKQKLTTRVDAVARFLGIPLSGKGRGRREQSLEFELVGTERAITSDTDLNELVRDFYAYIPQDKKRGHRYFVIREARSADKIHYKLDDALIADLGGSAELKKMTSVKSSLRYDAKNSYELSQTFPERMRVMFLPEEIVPVETPGKSHAFPVYGVKPVNEVLVWSEPDDAQ